MILFGRHIYLWVQKHGARKEINAIFGQDALHVSNTCLKDLFVERVGTTIQTRFLR